MSTRASGCAIAAAIVVLLPLILLRLIARPRRPLAPLLVPDSYDSLSKIARLRLPVVILHGTRAEVVPVRMGRALAAAGKEVRFIEAPEATF
jgi:fermentation-respiration switch protein FrsA (DUF1100 family)